MQFQIEQGIEVLQSTPGVLRAMLSGLSSPWIQNNYGPETFSPFDVVGHLIHGEQVDWLPRVKIILEYGESKPFEPFDRYAMYEQSKGKTICDLLDEFTSLRERNIEDLKAMNLTPKELALRGTHPDLGPVTIAALLVGWVTHDLNHIHQIAKCMAYQYKDESQPWVDYQGVFK